MTNSRFAAIAPVGNRHFLEFQIFQKKIAKKSLSASPVTKAQLSSVRCPFWVVPDESEALQVPDVG